MRIENIFKKTNIDKKTSLRIAFPWKKLELFLLRSPTSERLFILITFASLTLAISIFTFIFFNSLFNATDRLSLSFFFTQSSALGTEGGILYQLLGSLLLLTCTGILVTPLAFSIAIFDFFAKSKKTKVVLKSVLHTLNATPSILYGILGFMFFTYTCHWGKSWLAGSIILALMILPTVTSSLVQNLATLPKEYIETAKSLGLKDDAIIVKILLPYSKGSFFTGILMGLARAAGETAPIMFTATVFFGATLPNGIKDNPVLALPYHIFNLIQDVVAKEAVSSAWATAFVLMSMILLLSLLLAPFRFKSHEEAQL